MKKVILASLVATSLLYAESKTELLSSDASMKQSSREAVMALSDLGLAAKKFTFPVYYTPAGEKAISVLIGHWSVRVRENYMDGILEENYPFLIPSRFDKLVFNKSKADVITATKNITLNTKTKQFSYSTGSLKDFQKRTLSYLNSEIAPKIKKVLAQASDARYKEMPADEAESFIKTRAKESGMPAEVLQTLINSSYVFNIYMEKMRGSLNIAQVKHKDMYGNTYYTYDTSLSAPLNLDLTVYEYKNSKFQIRSTISSQAQSLFGALNKMVSGGSTASSAFLPRERDAQKVFDDVLKSSFKDNIIALSTRIKEDDVFKVNALVSNVGIFSADLSIGNQENVRVDHPFIIRRDIDGESRDVALLKVRKVGDSCLALSEEMRTNSSGQIISGFAEEADMAYEHPWTGVFGALYYKQLTSTFTYNDVDTSGGALGALGVGFNGDLGYIANSESLSEWWFNLDFFFGAGSEGSMSVDGTNYAKTTGSFAMGVNFGLQKRFYLMNNLFIAGAADFAYETQAFNITPSDSVDNVTLNIDTLSFEPKIKMGYNFGPNVDLNAYVGYDMPLGDSTASYTVGENDAVDVTGYAKKAGLSAGLTLNIHTDFAGPFTNMFSKPSTRCEKLKK